MSPDTVNTSGVVGEGTSFDLTLTGGSPYTYTETFGDICAVDVVIKNDTATVTIIPETSGTLTGSITFNNEATCNITIDAAPAPEGFQPTTVTETMTAYDIKDFDFRLLGYDSSTETVEYSYSVDSEIELSISDISGDPLPDGYRLSIETSNETEQALVGNIYVTAEIHDKNDYQVVLREYTATINLTIQPV